MKKEKKEVPVKNYIFLSIIVLVTILLAFYFYLWYLTYEESKLNNQIMDRYMQVINYNELDNFLVENKDSVIYVSKLNNKEIREFEKKLKLIINDYSLNNTILYLDLTDKNIDKLKLEDKNINYPAVLIYKNGKIISYFDIKKNNYDINLLKEYLIEEGIINND